MPEEETLEALRRETRGLGQKLREIDPKLLVVLAAGNPRSVKSLPFVQVTPLPASILNRVVFADGWEQKSWHDVWADSGGWTDVWGQSPGPAIEQIGIVGGQGVLTASSEVAAEATKP